MKQPANENINSIISAKWMTCPKQQTEYPGLAYISVLDELIVAKERDALHDVIGKNGMRYTIFNKLGEKVFLAVQVKRCHKFDLKIFNYYGNEVIEVKRPHKYCLNRVLVWAPPGNFVGSVDEARSCVNTYLVKNPTGQVVLTIRAQGLFHYVYKILSDNKEIGTVMKRWKMAAVLNVDNFGVSFPIDFGVGDKAVLLGACFLIGCLKY